MTFRFACEHPEQLAAIAPSIAQAAASDRESRRPRFIAAAAWTAGTADPLMSYDGASTSRVAAWPRQRRAVSVPET